MDEPDQAGDRIAVERVDPLTGSEWDRLVVKHAGHTVFHRSAWARVLHGTYGHRPHYLRFVRGGVTTALVPLMEVRGIVKGRRGVSLPFSDGCDPLLSDGRDGRFVTGHLAGLAGERGWKCLEIRGGGLSAAAGVPAAPEGSAYLAHELVLQQDPERQFAACESATRRAIRKAARAGLTTTVSTSGEAMRSFYHLHELTRKRHGVPPQPRAFFRAIQHELIEPGEGFVVLAGQGGHPVAGAVFLCSKTSALYKFGASDPEAWEMRPNNLAMWRGIETLIERGCRTLHFGRTEPANRGLRRFKRSWGARELALDYVRFRPADRVWARVAPGSPGASGAVFKLLPLALNRLAGKLIYPQID